ncbi:MAG: M3 family metallopeptidase, partial [bacterium]|nr:M3 family metallopeptidase [bacterium]
MSGSNPLASIPFRIPFDEIRAEHVEPAIEQLIGDARARLERLASADGPRTFENTMRALDLLTEPLDRAVGVVRHLESVATYPELRAVYNKVQPGISAFYSSIPLHEGLWKRIREYAGAQEAKALEGVRRRFLTKTMDDFRRHGADLDPAGKQRLEEIEVELTKLTTRFAENTLDATNAFELEVNNEADLAGLPPGAVEAARESAKSKDRDGWRFTLQAPSYLAVMTYLDRRDLRHRVWHAYNTRASAEPYDNREVMVRILDLRRAKADLLGYRDYADFILEDRMSKNGAAAQAFLDRLRDRTQPHFEWENEQLTRFRRELEGPNAPAVEPWDVAYYAEKLRKARFDFNEEDLRPYFPLDRVVDGMFELVRRLYGIRVVEEEGVPLWDSATRYYKVVDGGGAELGAFYADWFPRENKRGGAWMDSFITGQPVPDGLSPHLGLMCGNLTPPAGGKPALLTHREVETVFHEFGHLLHHLLTTVPVRSLAGTNVAWDFVELPS